MVKYERSEYRDYISAHDALKRSIFLAGLSQKEIAVILWPQKPDTKDIERAIDTSNHAFPMRSSLTQT